MLGKTKWTHHPSVNSTFLFGDEPRLRDRVERKYLSFLAGCVMVGVGLFGVASFLM
jgi:hypothetical protein